MRRRGRETLRQKDQLLTILWKAAESCADEATGQPGIFQVKMTERETSNGVICLALFHMHTGGYGGFAANAASALCGEYEAKSRLLLDFN